MIAIIDYYPMSEYHTKTQKFQRSQIHQTDVHFIERSELEKAQKASAYLDKTLEVMRPWYRLPGEAVAAPLLEMFQAKLDRAGSNQG